MIYNDFQILSDNTYFSLNNHYLSQKKDRKTYANILYSELAWCHNILATIKPHINLNIKKQLNNSKNVLQQILENLLANFKIEKTNNSSAVEFNIFYFIRKLIQTLTITNSWLIDEEKTYYQQFIKNTNASIIAIISNLLSSLENSEIIFFKHM